MTPELISLRMTRSLVKDGGDPIPEETMSEPLIAEDLLLLLTHDRKGKVQGAQTADLALAGAVLVELAATRRLDVTDDVTTAVAVSDESATGDSLLDDMLAKIKGRHGITAQEAVRMIAEDVRRPLQDRLVERGVLRHETTRFEGFNKWPTADSSREDQMRAGLYRVLTENADADERQTALLALLTALDLTEEVAAEANHILDPKATRTRVAELLEQGSDATKVAVKAVQAAAGPPAS